MKILARNNNQLVLVIIIFIILGSLSGFCFGVSYGQSITELKVLVEEKIVEVPVEVLVEVPVLVEIFIEVERTIEVEVLVEKPLELRDFENVEELANWIQSRAERQVIFLVSDDYDCDDAAREMVEDALEDGYWLWVQVVEHPYRIPKTGRLITIQGSVHALCSTIVDNQFYYIEPQIGEYWPTWLVD